MKEQRSLEEFALRTTARLDLESDEIREYIYAQWSTLDWHRLIQASMQARIPSLLTRCLVPLEIQTASYLSENIFDDLWKVEAIRNLYLHAYLNAPDTYSPLARFHYALTTRRQNVTRALAATSNVLLQHSIPALIIKGSALAPLYPPNTRDSSDVDIVLQSPSAVWLATQVLRPLGFKAGILSVSQRTPLTVGIKTTFTTAFGAEVDVHGGGFDLISLGFLEAPLWQRSSIGEIGENTAGRLPSLEDSLLIIAAHLCREGSMTLRDMNDVYLLLSRKPKRFDWDYVISTSRQNELISVLQALLAETTSLYPDLYIPTKYFDRSFTTVFAQHAMRRTRPGKLSWAIPLHIEHLAKLDGKRYGARIAIRHIIVQSISVLEKDLRWFSLEMNNDSKVARWLAGILRYLLRKVLIRGGWRLWNPPTGGHIWFVPITPKIDGQEVTIVGIAADDSFPSVTFASKVKRYDQMVLYRSSHKNEPEFLVTPTGLYYSTRYAETKFPISQLALEQLGGQILKTLVSERVVVVQASGTAEEQDR